MAATFHDLFADTAGTGLTSHTIAPVSGGLSWTQQQGSWVINPSGTLVSSSYTDGDTVTVDAGSESFTLTADMFGTTNAASPAQADLLIRWESLTSYLCVESNAYTDTVNLQTRSGGTVTTLLTYTVPGGIASGQVNTVRVDVYGDEITMWVDGVEVGSTVTSFLEASTTVGFRMGRSGGNTAGSPGLRAFTVEAFQGTRIDWPWTVQQGRWQVSPAGRTTSFSYTDGDTLTTDAGSESFTLTARMFGTLSTDQTAQADLVVRWSDLTNYLCVEANPLTGMVALQTRNGAPPVVPLITYLVPGGIASGQVVEVRVDVDGPEVTMWVDGVEVASAYTEDFAASTTVGFRMGKSSGNTAGSPGFDEFTVEEFRGNRYRWPAPVRYAGNPVVGQGVGRTVTDMVTNGTTTVTSAAAAFTPSDVGRPVVGTNIPTGGTPLGTRIASVTNASTAVLTQAASGSGTDGTLTIGEWDGEDVNNPNVTWDPVNNRWVLYYSGYFSDGSNAGAGTRFQHMGVAYATDLMGPWTKDPSNPVFTSSSGDGIYAMNGGLVYHGGQWVHLYGSSTASVIAVATSPDLHTWTRSGTAIPRGSTGEWDQHSVFDGFIRERQDGVLECWYAGRDPSLARGIGRATSIDGGYTWVKDPANPILSPSQLAFLQSSMVGEPSVLVLDGKEDQELLVLFDCPNLAPASAGFVSNRRVGGALTFDGGASWRFRTTLMDVGSAAAWDSKQAFDSFMMVEDGTLYLFYAGADTTGPALNLNIQVGVATQEWTYTTFVAMPDDGARFDAPAPSMLAAGAGPRAGGFDPTHPMVEVS